MLIPPPGDIVIVTKMRRVYIVGGEKCQGKLGNVYFHTNINCVRSKYAHFFPSLLCVTTRTKPTYAYSQEALTDGVRVFSLGLTRLALYMYIKKEMK